METAAENCSNHVMKRGQ